MASGSYEIDTFSWYKSFPLSTPTHGFSTGTLFAVGNCGFMSPFTFYQYQSTVGFTDTSTMSVSFTNYVCTSLTSTTNSLLSTIGSNARTYMSTIPLTRWISASTVLTNPFTFPSTFPIVQSTCGSTITSTIQDTFISTGLFGFSTINAYENCPISCPPYTYPSTIPVLASTFTSTLLSSVTSNFVSSGAFGPLTSSFFAPSFPFDFTSTYTETSVTLPYVLQTSNLWLGEGLSNLIYNKQYDVWAEYQYSITLTNTGADPYVWVSTVGVFNTTTVLNVGRTTINRIGTSNTFEIYTKQMFKSQGLGSEEYLPFLTSNFHIELNFFSSITTSTMPSYDIFIPGQNNFTFTLVPVTSTIVF